MNCTSGMDEMAFNFVLTTRVGVWKVLCATSLRGWFDSPRPILLPRQQKKKWEKKRCETKSERSIWMLAWCTIAYLGVTNRNRHNRNRNGNRNRSEKSSASLSSPSSAQQSLECGREKSPHLVSSRLALFATEFLKGKKDGRQRRRDKIASHCSAALRASGGPRNWGKEARDWKAPLVASLQIVFGRGGGDFARFSLWCSLHRRVALSSYLLHAQYFFSFSLTFFFFIANGTKKKSSIERWSCFAQGDDRLALISTKFGLQCATFRRLSGESGGALVSIRDDRFVRLESSSLELGSTLWHEERKNSHVKFSQIQASMWLNLVDIGEKLVWGELKCTSIFKQRLCN